jgi:creatinine amidohydrolase
MPSPRPFVLHEANYRQLLELRPNLAVLPWGATEAHNFHLPYGTDNIEATALGESAVELANSRGAQCVLLPTLPFGQDGAQLKQVATISLRASTQAAILFDIADSLVRQGIDRLLVLNFHGGNEFKSTLRDIMLDLPIFLVQANAFALAPRAKASLENAGDHADEFETSLLLHLTPDWVEMENAGAGEVAPSQLPHLSNTPGVWAQRDWAALSKDTGSGDPRRATPQKGAAILAEASETLARVLLELSLANNGDFPFIVPTPRASRGISTDS